MKPCFQYDRSRPTPPLPSSWVQAAPSVDGFDLGGRCCHGSGSGLGPLPPRVFRSAECAFVLRCARLRGGYNKKIGSMAQPAPRRGRRGRGTRWLQETASELAASGVKVRSLGAAGGVLRIVLDIPSELTVEVAPRQEGRGYFRQTRRFGVSYRGTRQLEPAEEHVVARLCETLARIEERLPDVFDAGGVVEMAESGRGRRLPEHTVEYSRDEKGRLVASELLLRLTSRCNQDCPFCSAPIPHADALFEEVFLLVDRKLAELPNPMVTLTGGEPALWPRLGELVTRLVEHPRVPRVRVQTNAVPFAERRAVAGWPQSDKLSFFVSFHGATPCVYDLCTGSTGQFDRAVAGTQNLLGLGTSVVLNLVATRFNFDHILDWVRAVPTLFPRPRTPTIHFSIAMCPEHRPRAPECLVRYTELAPRLEAAAALAAELGVECEPLLASSHASIPPCMLGERYRVRGMSGAGTSLPVQRPDEVAVESLAKPWVKSRSCARCSEDPYCLGVPRPYAARFGLREMRPIVGG